MADNGSNKLTRRSEAHADVRDSRPFRQRIEQLTETEFGRALLERVRAAKGNLAVRNLNAEWLESDEALIYEMSADLQPVEE